jgi:hypothetical protein
VRSEHPRLVGKGNVYVGVTEFWRIVSQRIVDAEPALSLPLTADDETDGFDERRLMQNVMWKSPPAFIRPDLHLAADYRLSDDEANPVLRIGGEFPGFDPDAVRDFAQEVAKPPLMESPPPSETPVMKPVDKPASVVPEKMMMPIVPMTKP